MSIEWRYFFLLFLGLELEWQEIKISLKRMVRAIHETSAEKEWTAEKTSACF